MTKEEVAAIITMAKAIGIQLQGIPEKYRTPAIRRIDNFVNGMKKQPNFEHANLLEYIAIGITDGWTDFDWRNKT